MQSQSPPPGLDHQMQMNMQHQDMSSDDVLKECIAGNISCYSSCSRI